MLWTQNWISSVFSQLGRRCHSGDKCWLTALLGLKQKQETSQHIEEQTHTAYSRKARDLRESFQISDSIIFHSSQKEVWDHTSFMQQQGEPETALSEEPVIVLRSEVKPLKTKLPANHDFRPRDGNWTLNMPAVKRPMDDQFWPTNHNKGWEVKVLCLGQVLGAVWGWGGTHVVEQLTKHFKE